LLDATTAEQLLPDIHFESLAWSALAEVVKKRYIGQKGPAVRSFSDGYDISIKFDPNNAAALVVWVRLVLAKQNNEINDEFAAAAKFGSPNGGQFRVRFLEIQWDTQSFNLANQHELLSSDIKGTGSKFTIERL
jgi:hypothetical protein